MPSKKYTAKELEKLSIEELQRISNDLDSGSRTTPIGRTTRSGDDRACGANNIGDGECSPDCNTFDDNWDNGDCCPETCVGWDGPGTEPCGEDTNFQWNQCYDPCSPNNIFSEFECNCGECML